MIKDDVRAKKPPRWWRRERALARWLRRTDQYSIRSMIGDRIKWFHYFPSGVDIDNPRVEL